MYDNTDNFNDGFNNNFQGFPNSNFPGIQPIVMPTRLYTRQCFNMVEQPLICPIECRSINNLVRVPRCYTTVNHTSCNNF